MYFGQAWGDGFQTSKEDTELTHNLNLPPRSLSATIAPVHALFYIAPPADPSLLGKVQFESWTREIPDVKKLAHVEEPNLALLLSLKCWLHSTGSGSGTGGSLEGRKYTRPHDKRSKVFCE